MWDWDAIDADYFTNSSGGQAAAAVPGGIIGPPAILSAGHQLRPTTSAGEDEGEGEGACVCQIEWYRGREGAHWSLLYSPMFCFHIAHGCLYSLFELTLIHTDYPT